MCEIAQCLSLIKSPMCLLLFAIISLLKVHLFDDVITSNIKI